MKKLYVAPHVEVVSITARSSFLESSYIPIGGYTDEYDTRQRSGWDDFDAFDAFEDGDD